VQPVPLSSGAGVGGEDLRRRGALDRSAIEAHATIRLVALDSGALCWNGAECPAWAGPEGVRLPFGVVVEHPEEWELVAFFGQHPDASFEEEAEFFGSWSFTLRLDDGDILTFEVSRSFSDLGITLRREGTKEIRMAARDLKGIKVEQLHGVETLVAVFGTEPNLQQARLTLRPTLDLDWGSRIEV
jgi:hypothetical protein